MMKLPAAAAVAVLFAAGPSSAQRTIKMEPAVFKAARWHCHMYLRLDANGHAEKAFPTKTGKLVIRVAAGAVRADTNGDGAVDDADAPAVKANSTGAIPVPVVVAGREFTYAIVVSHVGDRSVMLNTWTALVGKSTKARIALFDTDMDGVFDKRGEDAIVVQPKEARTDGFMEPTKLAPLISYGRKLYDLDVRDHGFTLGLEPYEGAVSTVTLTPAGNADHATLTLEHVDGLMSAKVGSGRPGTLAAGEYRITQCMISWTVKAEPRSFVDALFGGGSGSTYRSLHGYCSADEAPVVKIAPGENTLTPGAPFVLDFTAQVWKGTTVFYNVSGVYLTGAAGERYRARAEDGEVWCALRSGGRELHRNKLEFG